jgi:hypothetical protein
MDFLSPSNQLPGLKSSIFWDTKPCSPLKANRLFGGASPYLLATGIHAGFLLGLFPDPENGGDMFLRNVG